MRRPNIRTLQMQDTIDRQAKRIVQLETACIPVLAEAKERADYMHDSWNPDAHVELTLTIAELRAIRAAVDVAPAGRAAVADDGAGRKET